MSIRAKFLKKQYDIGRLDNEGLKEFVAAGQITAEDYKAITGEEYTTEKTTK